MTNDNELEGAAQEQDIRRENNKCLNPPPPVRHIVHPVKLNNTPPDALITSCNGLNDKWNVLCLPDRSNDVM